MSPDTTLTYTAIIMCGVITESFAPSLTHCLSSLGRARKVARSPRVGNILDGGSRLTATSRTVLLVTNIPTPYRIPLFNELADLFRENGLSLRVVFGAFGYERRKWAIDMTDCCFDYVVLDSGGIQALGKDSISFSYPGLLPLMRREQPIVTIIAGFSWGTIKLWLRNILIRTPYIIWSGATENAARPTSQLRRWQRRLLVRSATGYIAYGSKAKRYLESLGAPADRISIAINTVDTTFYRNAKIASGGSKTVPDRKILTYVGHLTAGKRLDLAFMAVQHLKNRRSDFIFRIIGEGPEEASLKTRVQTAKMVPIVNFEGFKQKTEVALALAKTDIFLFPSDYDIWGLVLVEAMAAGLPCIASIRAGATEDLIQDGITGYAIDFNDSEAVASRIDWLLDHPAEATAIGDAARKFIEQNVTLQRSAKGILEAVHCATSGHRSHSTTDR